MSRTEFLTYLFVPLSVGMFPHLFQHWMTAKDVKTFRPVVILHPLFIMLVWAPCILLGVWATSATLGGAPLIDAAGGSEECAGGRRGEVDQSRRRRLLGGRHRLGHHVARLPVPRPEQHVHARIIAKAFGEKQFSDRQKIMAGRVMVVAIVATAYMLSQCAADNLSVGSLVFLRVFGAVPLVFAALYWRRVTTAGAIASIVATLAAWAYLFRESNWGADKDYLFHGMLPAAAIFAASAVTIVIISLVTRPPAAEVVQRFFSGIIPPSAIRLWRTCSARGACRAVAVGTTDVLGIGTITALIARKRAANSGSPARVSKTFRRGTTVAGGTRDPRLAARPMP